MKRWLAKGRRSRRLLIALALYVVLTGVFFASAPRDRITTHTPFNHFALLADSWLHRQLDIRGTPPPYAGGNDFAEFHGKHYVIFPPVPALWLVPWVKLGGFVENVRDGQAFLWLAGLGPALMWLVLEKLRRTNKSERCELTNALLAALLGVGTVYWFTTEQGTVWFAAHVVGVVLGAAFVLFAIDAEHPVLAGIAVSMAWLTRTPMLLLGIVFALEAVRMSMRNGFPERAVGKLAYVKAFWRSLNARELSQRWSLFLLPVMAAILFAFWYNWARFHNPTEVGYRFLTVAWRGRIEKWGLFSYHYLARNLGVMLTSLPFTNPTPPYVQINEHGLALWVTSPFLLWVIWPRKAGWQYFVYATAAILVCSLDVLYQNTGWQQFGFRFSNDFIVPLFVLIAIGGRRLGAVFWSAAIVAVLINCFGALTFERANCSKYYFSDASQKTIYQPD